MPNLTRSEANTGVIKTDRMLADKISFIIFSILNAQITFYRFQSLRGQSSSSWMATKCHIRDIKFLVSERFVLCSLKLVRIQYN